MLGLPYPGGPEIEKSALGGNPAAYDFPRSMLESGDYAFSFSGLKTSMLYLLPQLGDTVEALGQPAIGVQRQRGLGKRGDRTLIQRHRMAGERVEIVEA